MVPLDYTIPASAIASIIAVIVILLAAVIAVFIILARKFTMNLSSIILGFLMYVFFDTILLNLFDSFLLGEVTGTVKELVCSASWSYSLYVAFINALFYTAGFNVVLRVAMNSDTGVGSGIAVGLGTGASYVVLGAVRQLISKTIAAFEINRIGAAAFLAQAEEANRQALAEEIEVLRNTAVSEVLMSGYQNLMMLIILLSASTVLYLAVTHRSPFWNMYIIMGMLLLVFLPPPLFTDGVIKSPLILQALMTLGAACFAYMAVRYVMKYGSNPMRH